MNGSRILENVKTSGTRAETVAMVSFKRCGRSSDIVKLVITLSRSSAVP